MEAKEFILNKYPFIKNDGGILDFTVEELSNLLVEYAQFKSKELVKWKKSATTIFDELDLQQTGAKLGIRWGESISKQLPIKIDELLKKVKTLESSVEEALIIIQVLQAYGSLDIIEGVTYPEGTHREMINKAQRWLWNNRKKS